MKLKKEQQIKPKPKRSEQNSIKQKIKEKINETESLTDKHLSKLTKN